MHGLAEHAAAAQGAAAQIIHFIFAVTNAGVDALRIAQTKCAVSKRAKGVVFQIGRIAGELPGANRARVAGVGDGKGAVGVERRAAAGQIGHAQRARGHLRGFLRAAGKAQPGSEKRLGKRFTGGIQAGNPVQPAGHAVDQKLLAVGLHVIQTAFFEQPAFAVVSVHVGDIAVVGERGQRLDIDAARIPLQFEQGGLFAHLADELAVPVYPPRPQVIAAAAGAAARVHGIVNAKGVGCAGGQGRARIRVAQSAA